MKIKNKSGREIMQLTSGILLVSLVIILNGFLSFISVGFNFENLKTASYWASFFILFASEMAVMFGVYIIQKMKDLKNNKITDLQTEIQKKRDVIYGVDKVTEAEDWLREIYNYKEKLLIFETNCKNNYEKLKLQEPNSNERFYKFKKKRYDKSLKRKDYLAKQMEYIRLDKKRISLLISKDDEQEIEQLNLQLDTIDYAFKTAKIKYRDVYWGNLLSDIDEVKKRETTTFFSEKTELSLNFIRYLGFGIITSAFITAIMFPTFNNTGWQTVLSCIVSFIILITFMLRGVLLSHKIILGRYYKALEKRKSIYNKMLKDLGISKIVIEEESE